MPPREARIVALCFGVLGLVVAGLILFAPMRDVVLRFVHDDAFYYFGVARGWKRYGFPTFDGIDATNGYHLDDCGRCRARLCPARPRRCCSWLISMRCPGSWRLTTAWSPQR